MEHTADVVIVGAGVVGASIAWHLTEAGVGDVVLLERESRQGLGSTGKATGGVRAQFSSPINIALSLHSLRFFSELDARFGADCGYRPNGYLFLATNERQWTELQENVALQRRLGLEQVELLSTDAARNLAPFVRFDDVVGASFCSIDGLIDPSAVMNLLTSRAGQAGARIWLDAELTSIEIDADRRRVRGVSTTRGRITTRTVVNAAGPWAAAVARMAGIELPVTPLRRHLLAADVSINLDERLPMVIDLGNGFHFRRLDPGKVLMGWPDPSEPEGFETEFDERFVEKILPRAVRRVPGFDRLTIDRSLSRAGLYEMTPDHHPILGESKEVEGMFFANGFSGHGVMHSPATGKILADLITTGRSALVDVDALSLERFRLGRLHDTGTLL